MTRNTSRREFLRRAGALTGLAAAAPWALNLSAAAQAAALTDTADDGYRALVCVFLYGGNDNHNTVVPYDETNYAKYASIRTSIALPRDALAATEIVPANPWTDGRRMALHPALLPMKSLFDDGQLAMVMNVGTLMREGTTIEDYKANRGLPPKLFSHNDQQSVWQSSLAEGANTGWAGRIGDLFAADNEGSAQFTSISASGNAVMMSGRNVVQYQVSSQGSIAITKLLGSDVVTDAVKTLLQGQRTHLLEEAHASIARRSISADVNVRSALAGVPDLSFPDSKLGAQFKIVARLIAARAALGVRKQVFFVSLGGFDTHNNLIDQHPLLLGDVAASMKAFHDATVSLGVDRQVTTFTGADFGRTLANNGDGSDHGWGSHHMVMGGAVKRKAWVGQLPDVSVNGPHDVGSGRLLPAIGVDQYGATLAAWMGVSEGDMADVFPNIGNYSTRILPFMQV